MLTDKAIKILRPTKTSARHWDKSTDPTLKGFGVQVNPSGRKVFIMAYTSPETGKRRHLQLGAYPGVTLAEARQKARDARALIDRGIDPLEQKDREEAAAGAREKLPQLGTVAELFELYIRDLELDKKAQSTINQVRNICKRDIVPAIGDRYANSITEGDVDSVLKAVEDRGALVLANRTRSYMRTAFKFGKALPRSRRWKGKTPKFELTYNPVSEVDKPLKREKPGERNLSTDELRTLWGTESIGNGLNLAIRLMLATGQRVEEVLGAEWSEFDKESTAWEIPAARRKKEDSHVIPLTPFHWQLLEQIHATNSSDKYLFPNLTGKAPRKSTALSQATLRFCKRSGFEHFAPRDLRRSWKILAGKHVHLSLEIRNRIQGHALQDVGAVSYDRYDYLPEKAAAMQAWVDWLQQTVTEPGAEPIQTEPKTSAKVIQLEAHRG